MEFTQQLPQEFEETWRREKERRKRVIKEGGEGLARVDCELRWIKAYNDTKMGLMMKERWKTSDGNHDEKVRTYNSQTYPKEVFEALREFRDASLLTDLTLRTSDGKSFHVHSPVLAAVSSLVRERVEERAAQMERSAERRYVDVDVESQRWAVVLGPEVDSVGLTGVLEFAYTGAIAALHANTLTAADSLGVPRVLDLCTEEGKTEESGGQRKEKRKISAEEQMRISLLCIRDMWMEKVACDVILEADEASFLVHRVILAASSDFFRGMFTSGMRESNQPCVNLPFLPASDLGALIDCSYSGTLPLSWGCVFEITCTALQLQFQSALSLCLDFLWREMDATSCLDVASFAKAYGMTELLEEADDFVLRNFREVSAVPKFQDLPPEKLLHFVSHDGLCVSSELPVFRAIVSWVEADPEGRLSLAGELMSGVRFPLMTFREFKEVRAVDLRMECKGNEEVELYGSATKEFYFGFTEGLDRGRVRRPKDSLVVVGGDQLNPDVGQRILDGELWHVNSVRSGTGFVKQVEWRKLGVMPDKPRFRHGVGVMNGQLYVVGGCHFYTKNDIMKSAYRYDPMQDSWKRLADMQDFRSNFPVVVRGERLYAIGGDKEINTNLDSVEVYNPDSDSWSYVKPLDQALSGHAVAVLDGEIFISGGFNCKYVCLVSMFLYHPERGTTYLADMAQNRAQHCMEALQGRLYVAGGACNLREFYTDQRACEVYDPVSDTWTSLTSMPVPHVGAASAVLEGRIYILGGYSQEDYSESGLVHRYDASTQRWDILGRMPGAITDIRACLLTLPKHLRQ